MTTPNRLQWTAEVVHSLLNYPQRLLDQPDWALVITQLGGMRQLRQQLLTYPLKTKELRLLNVLISHPEASVDYYCDVLAIHPATFHRQQNALCQRLSGLLPLPQLDTTPSVATDDCWQRSKTSFIGRTLDLERIQLLFDQGCEWISLIGAAGMGKTRLALEMSRRVGPSFRDGMCLLHLNNQLDLASLAQHCLAQLELDSQAAEPQQTLQYYFGSRHLLLILDNLDQPEHAQWFIAVLQAAPFVRVISTGSQRLHVPHERLHHVERLGYPPRDDQNPAIDAYPALQLLVERLSAFQPVNLAAAEQFALLTKLCYLLAGQPLALELAASLIANYGLATLSTKLQSLYTSAADVLPALIKWSYAALQPTTQQLLVRLAGLPQHAHQPEILVRNGFSAEVIHAGLLEAQANHVALDWADWIMLPSSVQHAIANPEIEIGSIH